jgi:hypothetical protein
LWVLLDGFFLIASGLGWNLGLVAMGDLLSMNPEGWRLRLVLFAVAFPAVALALFAFFHPFFESSEEGEVSLDNEKGKVRISTRTISDYLQKKSGGVVGVETLGIRIQNEEGGKVSLHAEASVFADDPLPVVTKRIQTFIEEELKNTIGMQNIEGVHLHFKRIGGFQVAALPQPVKPAKGDEAADDAETVDVSPSHS